MRWDGRIGAGGNSGFQAVNLAAACGAAKIILTGFDMQHTSGKKHFHPDHRGELTNPDRVMLRNSAAILDSRAAELAARGVRVINATHHTALKKFERMDIKAALRD